jgi:hypothetical protein
LPSVSGRSTKIDRTILHRREHLELLVVLVREAGDGGDRRKIRGLCESLLVRNQLLKGRAAEVRGVKHVVDPDVVERDPVLTEQIVELIH